MGSTFASAPRASLAGIKKAEEPAQEKSTHESAPAESQAAAKWNASPASRHGKSNMDGHFSLCAVCAADADINKKLRKLSISTFEIVD